MTVGEMIKERRIELGLTLEQVGNMTGVSKSTVKKWETGYIANMKRDKIALVAKALHMNPTVFIDTAENKRNMLPANLIPVDLWNENIMLPVIGRVAAGISCHAEDNIEGYEYAPKDIVSNREEYVYLRVQGDSMAPMIMEDDLALIRCQSSIDSGTIAVVLIDGEDGVIKRVRYGDDWIELVSENPYYPPRRFSGEDVLRIRVFGKVIECKRKF